MNFPTPGSSWPGQGTIPAPTAPPRQARAREINTRNDRPRDRHRSLADGYRRTQISPRGTNARTSSSLTSSTPSGRSSDSALARTGISIMPGSILNETQRGVSVRSLRRGISVLTALSRRLAPPPCSGRGSEVAAVPEPYGIPPLFGPPEFRDRPGNEDLHGRRPYGFLALVLPSNLKAGHHRRNAWLDLRTLFATPCITRTVS